MRKKLFFILMGIIGIIPNSGFSADFSGSFRARLEYRKNQDLDSSKPDEISFINSRLRLGANFEVNPNISVSSTIQDSRVFGSAGSKISSLALEGVTFTATNSLGLESLDLLSGFLHIKFNTGDLSLSSKIGRQQISFGDERILGAFDWSNISNSFDGIRLSLAKKNKINTDILGFIIRENTVREGATEIPTGERGKSYLIGTYNTFSLSFFKKSLLDLYFLYLRDDVKVQKPANIFATGIRQLIEEQITNKLTFFETAEFVFEFGNAWDKRLKALALASKAGIRIGIIESFFEIDFATGGQTDKERKTFYNFFPTNHLHYGYADLFAWKNMWGIRSNLTLSPTRETKLMIDLWSFQLWSPYDFWYRAGQGPMLTNTAPPKRDIGRELDITFQLTPIDKFNISTGYSIFLPGKFPRAINKKDVLLWYFLQAFVKF